MEFLVVLNFTIGGPLQILISIVFLYDTLGPSIFAGVGILITLIPLNMVLVTMARKHQMKQMKLKDERLKLTSEAMNGIKVLKVRFSGDVVSWRSICITITYTCFHSYTLGNLPTKPKLRQFDRRRWFA